MLTKVIQHIKAFLDKDIDNDFQESMRCIEEEFFEQTGKKINIKNEIAHDLSNEEYRLLTKLMEEERKRLPKQAAISLGTSLTVLCILVPSAIALKYYNAGAEAYIVYSILSLVSLYLLFHTNRGWRRKKKTKEKS